MASQEPWLKRWWVAFWLVIALAVPGWAAPGVIGALQERSMVDGSGEISRFAALEFVALVRGEQFREPTLPSDTDYRLFGQKYFKDARYFLWQDNQQTGTVTTLQPEKLPSLYKSLETRLKSDQPLVPLSELNLVLATDQPLKVQNRKPVAAETLTTIDDLARAALTKEGISEQLARQVPRIWTSAAVIPGRPDAVVALYRTAGQIQQRGTTFKRIINAVFIAEPVTDKGQTNWQILFSLISFGGPENTTVYGPLAVADINGDNFEDLIIRETRFDRWTYGIYGRKDGRWQSRFTSREGNYSTDIPTEPPDDSPS